MKKKNNKIYKSDIYIRLTSIILTLLFCSSYYLYYLSLEKCTSGVDICGNNFKWIYQKVTQLTFSCFFSSILFILIIFNIISRLHLFHFVAIFIYLYYISHGYSFEDHGLYNFIAFFIVFALIIISGIIIKIFASLIIIKIESNKVKKFSVIIILTFIYFNSFDPMNCSDWGKGLNNTFIEDDLIKYKCKINFPKKCPYKIFKYFQDFTKLIHVNCSIPKKNNQKVIFQNSKSPYINNKTKRIGFPLTNKNKIGKLDSKDDHELKSFVLNNLFDIDKKEQKMKKPELILDFSKEEFGEYVIDVKYNESLSKERKKLEKKVSPYSENIMIIFIDSVSRGNSIRQLKKTLKFFEKFMSYNGGYNPNHPKEKYHSFQFFKYHAFKNNTSGNFPILFYGKDRNSKKLVLLTKYFKENGFITNYDSDFCQKDNIRTFHDFTESEVYDHQFLICDPNKINYNSIYKKCLYGKTNVEYLCDYAAQFWRKYKKNRKFSVIILNDGHEGTLEALKYTDIFLYNYLSSLFEDNLLKNSSVFLLSDHGVVVPSLYSLYDFYKKERGLPMLYLLINDRDNISYKDQYFYIYENQQNFITAYDIYNTINHLLYGDYYININNKTNEHDTPKSPLGKSLFTYIPKIPRTYINFNYLQHKICL